MIPPPPVTAPYPVLQTSLNLARTRLNDAIASIGGDILTDTQPFTGTMTNAAWRSLQAFLCNLGYSRYKKWFTGLAYPKTAALDPSVMNYLSWTAFFDGVGYHTNVPLLPQDFIAPLRVAERQNNGAVPYSAATNNLRFSPMTLCPDGLPEDMKRPWNGVFNWENDQLVFPGSLYSMDFKIEYAAYAPDFMTTPNENGDPILGNGTNITPQNMQVPIMRSESALANYIAAECASGRDDMDAGPFLAAAEKDAKLLMNNSDVKLKQRRPLQRRAYAHSRGGAGFYGQNQGYN